MLLKRVGRVLQRARRLAARSREGDGQSPQWRPVWARVTPADAFECVGPPENYYIRAGYRARLDHEFFDDTPLRDEWQREVYQFAREVAERYGLRRVADIGCGSGYKLMRYFRDYETLGIDLAPTVEYLRRTYPGRRWEVWDFDGEVAPEAELVICADVIEHLPDPMPLVRFIQRIAPEWIVMSTPERTLICEGAFEGPPRNRAHVREWAFGEFRAFMSSEFEVAEHFISNRAQATQCVLMRPRGRGADGDGAVEG